MGVPGAVQVRLFSPRNGDVSSWSLPVWMMGSLSYSVGMALGTHEPCIVLNTRVAQAMHIQEGDEVEFEILEAAERFTGAVSVNPNINADVVIHGAGLLGIATAESVYVRLSDLPTELTTVYGGASVYGGDGSEFSLTLKSGTVLKLPLQEIWAGVRIHEMRGSAVLYFDGASRNNPKGPAGFGYCIIRGQGGQENELVRGYGYYKSGTNNEMEYKGLLEGLTWALRLDLKTLHIRGDSELVIRQCNNEYQVNDAQLQVYYEKISELLQKGRNMGTEIFLEHISRDKNSRADWLANLGIDSQTHATVCNWNNINRLCRR